MTAEVKGVIAGISRVSGSSSIEIKIPIRLMCDDEMD